jgi:quercetin dioxygenase-like cupin family protein/ketosteroid isomerase-like protein
MKSILTCAAACALLALNPAAVSAEPPPPTKGPVDALISAPGNFKLLLENDQVRVLEYTLLPGALDHWHTHPPRIGYLLSGGKIRVTESDGSHEDYDEKTGEIYWGGFSPLHDTFNLGTTPYVALLVEVKGAPSAANYSADETAIRAQREAFNRAIADGNVPAIAAVLADNAQLMGGDHSTLTAGKVAQVALWSKDLKDKSRGIYVRTPDRVDLSAVGPMAMESGHWRGVDSKTAADWASGLYSAKWRRMGGSWKVESETYMTTACGGAWCPKK